MGSRGGRVPAAQRKSDQRHEALMVELRQTEARISALKQQGIQFDEQIAELQFEKRRNEDAGQQMIGRLRLVQELLGMTQPMVDVAQQTMNGGESTEEGEPEDEESIERESTTEEGESEEEPPVDAPNP